MRSRKVGWQKYEDVLEEQLHCPFIQDIIDKINWEEQNLIEELKNSGDYDEYSDSENHQVVASTKGINVSEDLLNEAAVLTNFECWVGHTNFNITPSIKSKLEKIDGVEVLKILSRYRFFIGIGKLFEFSEVRLDIEDQLL